MDKVNGKALADFKSKFQDMWVAMDPESGEVLSYDKDLKKLADSLLKLKRKYVLEKILPLDRAFVPLVG